MWDRLPACRLPASTDNTDSFCEVCMKQTLGMMLQLLALGTLPSIVIFQLIYGFTLIVMPISLLCGIVVFGIGTLLREAK